MPFSADLPGSLPRVRVVGFGSGYAAMGQGFGSPGNGVTEAERVMADKKDDTTDEGWFPKSREEFAEVFADGMAIHDSRREEESAKGKKDDGKEGGTDDSGDKTPPKRSWGQRFLGG